MMRLCCEIGWITFKDSWGRTQKIDTYVRELDLSGEKNKQEKKGLIAHNVMRKTGYVIAANDAKQLGEALKVNTTLTKLNLMSEKR